MNEMAAKDKITWITCPDCGGKIGIVFSVGKAEATSIVHEHKEEWPPAEGQPQDTSARLAAAGIDVSQLDIEEDDETISISPKKFLGDLWGPINDSMKTVDGTWIRDGRNSRWEIKK